jgi:nitrite reductase/ring-hydroxylating ferredoxin subunit/uncharacterized membrane protein
MTTRVLDGLEHYEALDQVADPAAEAAGRVLGGGRIKEVLSGTWLGHPLHPAAVAVPIGALAGVSVLDALGGAGSGSSEARRRLLAVGLLAAVPAAASGLSDWSDTSGGERRVGVAHAALNTVALGLYASSWLARGRRPGAGKVLAAAGLAVMGASGWLGGHLAYAVGVGVDVNAFDGGPTKWTAIGKLEEFPVGQPVAAEAGRVRLMVLHQPDKRVLAVANRCSHRGGPLSEGKVEEGCVTCPWHGSQFALEDGAVVRGPATRPQPAYETRLRKGIVEVRREEVRGLRTIP